MGTRRRLDLGRQGSKERPGINQASARASRPSFAGSGVREVVDLELDVAPALPAILPETAGDVEAAALAGQQGGAEFRVDGAKGDRLEALRSRRPAQDHAHMALAHHLGA